MAHSELSSRGKHSLNVLETMANRGIGFIGKTEGIEMHCAENRLSDEILVDRLSRPDMCTVDPDTLHYFDYRGTDRFRSAIADFFTEKFKASQAIDPENIVVTTGACTIFDLLAHSLAEPEDYFLCLAPFYYGTPPDLDSRSRVKCLPVQLPGLGKEAYDISIQTLENKMEEAKKKGLKVRGIVFVNPQNPTGLVYSPATIQKVLSFADRHNLHVIMDEIYALSIHDEETEFTSVLSLKHIPRPEMTHLVYGFSKDFGLAGFRCGVLHTWNKKFIDSIRYILYMCAVPALIQDKLTVLLSDKDWIDNVFLPESKKRLHDSYKYCTNELENMGITYFPGQAGVFVWANFSKFLREPTEESVLELHEEFKKNGVNLAAGTGFYFEQFGWFRITFATPRDQLVKGLSIIGETLEKRKEKR